MECYKFGGIMMLKQEDLYIGRRAAYKELRGILDTYIILKDTEGYSSNMSGTIAVGRPGSKTDGRGILLICQE